MEISHQISIEEIRNRPEIAGLKKLPGFTQPMIDAIFEKLLHLEEVNEILRTTNKTGPDFLMEVIDKLGIKINVEGKENIPPEGRAIFVSNHPTGLELPVLRAILDVRQDIYDISNPSLIELFPEIAEMVILAPSDERPERKIALAVSSLRKSIEILLQEKALVFFPAGTVAYKHKGEIEEQKWKKGPASLAKQTRAPVVPIFTDAKNSGLFYTIRNIPVIGEIFSTAMFIDQLIKQRGNTINITIRPPIPPEILRKVSTSAATRIIRNTCLGKPPSFKNS
jgi:1-acyl-sn-glycerol-3-phosphate acyltransferase